VSLKLQGLTYSRGCKVHGIERQHIPTIIRDREVKNSTAVRTDDQLSIREKKLQVLWNWKPGMFSDILVCL
jgi:hypothetical protein